MTEIRYRGFIIRTTGNALTDYARIQVFDPFVKDMTVYAVPIIGGYQAVGEETNNAKSFVDYRIESEMRELEERLNIWKQ